MMFFYLSEEMPICSELAHNIEVFFVAEIAVKSDDVFMFKLVVNADFSCDLMLNFLLSYDFFVDDLEGTDKFGCFVTE